MITPAAPVTQRSTRPNSPLISLDQRATWYPDPHARYGELMLWWLNPGTVLGWLLSSIFALSLARLSRST